MAYILLVKKNGRDRALLARKFKEKGHEVKEALNTEDAADKVSELGFDVVVTDQDTLAGNHALLKAVNEQVIPPYFIIDKKMPAWKEPYILEAGSLKEVIELIEQLQLKEPALMQAEINYLRHRQPYIYTTDNIVAESPQMKHILSMVKKICFSDATVLITGETGTGKELIASNIHFNSLRRRRAFVKVNCAALPETLLESELFGHEKGAFTGAYRRRTGRFEQANGGTLFLDEIGDMSLPIQAKVLRVIQEKDFERLGGEQTIKVDVSLIVATNRDLRTLIKEKKFREDLYYRINVVHLHLPPLRERHEDIPLLADFFLNKFSKQFSKPVKSFSPRVTKMLLNYPWPGNIRELENIIERAVLLAEGTIIHRKDLAIEHEISHPTTLKEAERELIIQALEKSNWVQKEAARLLDISKRVIHYKIKKYGIKHPTWIKNK